MDFVGLFRSTDCEFTTVGSGLATLLNFTFRRAPSIDCFDGMVVSWSIGTNPIADMVNCTLDRAVAILDPGEQPILHTDRLWPGQRRVRKLSWQGRRGYSTGCHASAPDVPGVTLRGPEKRRGDPTEVLGGPFYTGFPPVRQTA